MYSRGRRALSVRALWLGRRDYFRHGLILARRTREVLTAQGPAETVERARRWLTLQGIPAGWKPLGPTLTIQGTQTVSIERRYVGWRERHERIDEADHRRDARSCTYRPLVSVVMSVFDPPLEILREAVTSVLEQTYDRVELCVANAGQDRACAAYLSSLAGRDDRVRLTRLERNLGIAGNSNEALALATGEFVAFVDHDDLLAADALAAIVERLDEERELDVLYTDEDRLTPDGYRVLPYLKPDWSPEFLHSYMWTGHLSVYRRSLVESIGGFRTEYDGSQDYDLMLRAAATTDRIGHVAGALYHWRMIEGSAAAGGKSDARRTNLGALRSAIAAQGRAARVVEYPGANRVVFDLVERPLVSIVIPTDDLDNARASLKAMLTRTTYERFEVVIVTNSRVAASIEREHEHDGVRCVVHDGPFNFSLKCNLGARAARGTYLLFLNDDVEPLTEGWIESMLQYAQWPEIGGVSPKLLYPDDTIQYAGLVSGVRDLVGTAFHTWPRSDGSYQSIALSVRNVSCLTGACMLLRADDFHRVGGWDEVNTPIAHSDFDLSYRLQEEGLRLVYTPFAELRHLGHASRRHAVPDAGSSVTRADRAADVYLLRRWGRRLAHDPYYTSDMRELLYEDEGDYRIVAPPGGEQEEGWQERPRVLLVAHDLSGSGAPAILVEIARALLDAGMFVVVTASAGGPLVAACTAAGIPVVIDEKILDDPWRAERFIRGFDVVGANTVLSWRVVRVAAALAVPVVWLIQEPRFGVHLVRMGGRDAAAAFGDAERVVFPSRDTAALYAEFGNLERHVPLHYGIPDAMLDARQDEAIDETALELSIAHVGGLEERKGADVVVEALRLLSPSLRDRVRVYFVGLCAPEAAYPARIRRDATGLNVELVGAAPRDLTLAFIRDADLFVCTSRDESGPIVVLEAMALGKPIVTTKVGAAAEILRPGVDGELIDIDDARALADLIERLAEDPERRRQLGREARATYERYLTADRYGEAIVEVFREAMSRQDIPDGDGQARLRRASRHPSGRSGRGARRPGG